MKKNSPFDWQAASEEEWFNEYPFVFQSQLEAIKKMLPEDKNSRGLELRPSTGKFSEALDIKEGTEPSPQMRALDISLGPKEAERVYEQLPFSELQFDFVLIVSSINYFNDLHVVFGEVYRVLKRDGALIVGFMDRESLIGKSYKQHTPESTFYKQFNFFSVDKVVFELHRAGYKQVNFCQTLFRLLEEINTFEPAIPGYGQGSFVVIQAWKKG